MSSTPEEMMRDSMRAEFEATYSDFQLAELFIENGDPEMYFEEFVEIQFDEYCEMRLK